MKYVMTFEGSHVLITGAAGGIGAEIARGFLDNGASVILSDYSSQRLESVTCELKLKYPGAAIEAVVADITTDDGINALISAVKDAGGRLDVLVNNAGTANTVYSVNETREGWQRVIGLNLDAQFFVSRAIATEFMIPAKKGKIVNMCSLSAVFGIPSAVAYSSSKGALLQMTKSLAGEWARFNIQVNCVCPGFVETPLIAESMANERWMAYMSVRIPQRRLAKPEDVVGSVLYLSSSLADYVTGIPINVDGGFSAN